MCDVDKVKFYLVHNRLHCDSFETSLTLQACFDYSICKNENIVIIVCQFSLYNFSSSDGSEKCCMYLPLTTVPTGLPFSTVRITSSYIVVTLVTKKQLKMSKFCNDRNRKENCAHYSAGQFHVGFLRLVRRSIEGSTYSTKLRSP